MRVKLKASQPAKYFRIVKLVSPIRPEPPENHCSSPRGQAKGHCGDAVPQICIRQQLTGRPINEVKRKFGRDSDVICTQIATEGQRKISAIIKTCGEITGFEIACPKGVFQERGKSVRIGIGLWHSV